MLKPQAIFDQAVYLTNDKQNPPNYIRSQGEDTIQEFKDCISFLLCYKHSQDTFKAYRREIERLMQWCLSRNPKKSIIKLNREELQDYIEFIKSPPKSWVGTAHKPRFTGKLIRTPNLEWRPFVARDQKPKLSTSSLQAMLAILSTFYGFLQQEQICQINPVQTLRQKKRIIQQSQKNQRITRKLTIIQWQTVVKCAQEACIESEAAERSLFILSILYLLGLRISEIAPNELHIPIMGDFFKDEADAWWFKTIGKGNKYREVAVPDALLTALTRYRRSLGLSDLPHKNEALPLIPKLTGDGGIGIRHIRTIVQNCFDQAISVLKAKNLHEEAMDLSVATVHWLRHTAITADVQNRPIEHVRDDAGHNNSSITDRYIDSDQKDRHNSARNKQLIQG